MFLFLAGTLLYISLFLVLFVCSPLRATLPAWSAFLFARLLPGQAMVCPRAFLLVRLSAGLMAYWDIAPRATSSGNWHSRPAKHTVEEDAEIESARIADAVLSIMAGAAQRLIRVCVCMFWGLMGEINDVGALVMHLVLT